MITPHPTAPLDPALARGTLHEVLPATATRPRIVVLAVPNTNYQLHLLPEGMSDDALAPARVGKRLIAKVRVKARRVDVVSTGGQFVEPVYGRPRRVQGTVLAVGDGSLLLDAGLPVHVFLTDARQKVSDFSVGQLVSFDALDGATISP